jgi:hypothetical protein
VLGAAVVAIVAVLGGLGSWLGTRDDETRRTAGIGVSDPDSARADFNGDGFSDLAVGVPEEDLFSLVSGTLQDAGAVHVVYGSTDGLVASVGAVASNELLTQDMTGADDSMEGRDKFGSELTAGDFNGDRRSDLAVAIPWEDDVGAVQIFYGSPDGLDRPRVGANDQILRPADLGVTGRLTNSGDLNLAWGNFDGDAYGDLVVSVATADVGADIDAGALYVVFGSATGLDPGRRQTWTQDGLGTVASASPNDYFGIALAAGDFDGDQVDDLAVGASGENVGSVSSAGEINVLYGVQESGLSSAGAQRMSQATLLGTEAESERFGHSLAAGDFNGDSRDDLAVGVPSDDVRLADGSIVDRAGGVNVVYGSTTGLTAASKIVPEQLWHQDSVDEGSEIEDEAEVADHFGQFLASGDFDGDGSEDLAVTSRDESVGKIADAGAVNVIYGSSTEGLDASGDELFHQDRSGIEEDAETSDGFGFSLAAWNFGNGDEDDLAVGAVGESLGSVEFAGLVHVIYGDSASGLTSSGSQLWTQDSESVPNVPEASDFFGRSLG